ncbi:MAG: YdeI/OmpD-associated family protein [Cryomorphaceae bacterium]
MNPEIDAYFVNGCGRCPLGGTPDCKAPKWNEEMKELRKIVLSCGLEEELKWSVPCYTLQGKNVAIISAFKAYASLSFFKGSLLKDKHGLLERPGEHTQAARFIRFESVGRIAALAPVLRTYIFEAIELEENGVKVPLNDSSDHAVPEELAEVLNENPVLRAAFDALTPGRRRGYLLHIAQAKQSSTRVARIEKCIPNILRGKGLQDR